MKRTKKLSKRPASVKSSPAVSRAKRTRPTKRKTAVKKKPVAATAEALAIVRDKLQEYAERGIFRGFEEVKRGRLTAFRFNWQYDQPMELVFEPAKRQLRFENLLAALPPRGELYKRLKAYVGRLQSGNLPAYKSVDPRRAELTCTNRQDKLSLALTLKDGDYSDAIKSLITAVHELFIELQQSSPEYLVEQFNVPEE